MWWAIGVLFLLSGFIVWIFSKMSAKSQEKSDSLKRSNDHERKG